MWGRRMLLVSSVLLACSVSSAAPRQAAPHEQLTATRATPPGVHGRAAAGSVSTFSESRVFSESSTVGASDEFTNSCACSELAEPAPKPAAPAEPPPLPLACVPRAPLPPACVPFVREPPAPGAWRPTPHEPGELPRWLIHHSVPRDTIDNLAIRYGVPARLLRRWNGLSPRGQLDPREPRDLQVRARREPPPRQRLEIVAGQEDGWGRIARRYGVRAHHLRSWNRRVIGSSIEPGETVTVWVEPLVYEAILDDAPADLRAAQVPPGGHGIGTPQRGILVAGVQIPEGEGYLLRYPNSAWGTTWAVRHTIAAVDDFLASSGYTGVLEVGTMSRIRGGRIGGHVSHQSGRDLDVRLPSKGRGEYQRPDWAMTWALIQAFIRTGAVERIFLDVGGQRRLYRAAKAAGVGEDKLDALIQYPRGSRSNFGVVRHSAGHEGHIHVRFTCGPAEPECG